jgi:Caspase domain
MERNQQMRKPISRTMVSALMLAVAGTALLVASLGRNSHAQQEPNRQLERLDSTGPRVTKRIGLVIGNGAYVNAPPLKNPPNDARDMVATLRALGFEVTSGINVNQREMKRLIREFGQKLKAGGSGLFYYAGHGVQSKGRNYLFPVDADIQSEAEVEDSGVDLALVLNVMDEAQNGLNVVILDACRNNPFARSFRSASEGLAQVDAPTGTLIAYATAPGRVAADGTGQNGLYTSELLKAMQIPGLSALEVFMRVRGEVMKQTGNNQVPWEASSLVGGFYFSGRSRNASSAAPSNAEASLINRIDPAAFELSYWETIKNSTDPEDFRAYLEKYPNGQFSAIAKRRLLPSATLPSTANQPNETNIDQAVEVLRTLGSGRIEMGRFGEGTGAVTVTGKCQLKYETRALWNSKAKYKPSIDELVVSLPQVNIAGIAVSELAPPDRPAVWVVTARTLQGHTFTYSITGYENRSLEKVKVPTKTQNLTSAFVGVLADSETANRYAKAFANAARLCGAKSETF